MSKVKTIIFGSVFIITSLAFAAAGSAKLLGVPALHASFAMMGLPVWFGYFIGACELAGGIGLLIRQWRVMAAGGLMVIMLGAIFFHVHYEVPSHAMPAGILMVLLLSIIQMHRHQMGWLSGTANSSVKV
ncbi:MAG: DoxX family protein [Methylococcaceae bacterium]|jgi:uncharacterized membrane protein YphA (DoxX/SURF4 family)